MLPCLGSYLVQQHSKRHITAKALFTLGAATHAYMQTDPTDPTQLCYYYGIDRQDREV